MDRACSWFICILITVTFITCIHAQARCTQGNAGKGKKCCNGVEISWWKGCCNNVPHTIPQGCCNGRLYDVISQGCCNGVIYQTKENVCCNGTVVRRPQGISWAMCCGRVPYDLMTQVCCNHTTGLVTGRPRAMTFAFCCGSGPNPQVYDWMNSLCCDGNILAKPEGVILPVCCNGSIQGWWECQRAKWQQNRR